LALRHETDVQPAPYRPSKKKDDRMTSCEYLVDEHECGHPAQVRVVRATNRGARPSSIAICTLHAPDMFPIVAWAPIK
jgi:hypothetical protein